jgi:hypothetical protein
MLADIVVHVVKVFIFYASLNFKKVSVRERSPRVGLKVAYPSLWVAGYVTVWYQSFWLKHLGRYGLGLLVRVSWFEIEL